MREKGKRRIIFCFILLMTAVSLTCGGGQARNIMIDEPVGNQNPGGGGPVGGGESNSTSIPELEKFIFTPDRFTNEVVPRKLDPAKVAKFLNERITEKEPLKVFVQVEKVAAFYDTFEIAPKFRQFLNKSEAGEEGVQRSIVITRTIGRVGRPEDVQFAAQYYNFLVGKVESPVEFEQAVLLYEVLGLVSNVSPLRQKLEAKIKTLEGKQNSDDQARLQYLELVENVSQDLNRAEKVQALKDKILKNADRRQRVEEEIKAYLAIDYGYIEYLAPWAAARLRRETWEAQPAEQIMRAEKPALKDDLTKLLRAFLDKLETFASLDDAEKEGAKIKLLRAIKFFDGKISEQEEMFLAQFKGTQLDILANEGFMLE
jgi:hypothetical protein